MTLLEAGKAWVAARDTMCQSKVSDPNWRELLNNLSNTENNLSDAIRLNSERKDLLRDIRLMKESYSSMHPESLNALLDRMMAYVVMDG